MAKIEAGKLDLNVEEVDLRAIIQDAVRLLGERAQQQGVALVTELPEGKLSLEADRRAIKQILLNLLSNAVKFTLPGGTVAVRVRCRAGATTLEVQDDGIGIPAEDLPRLGQPFEQASADPMLSKGGTGLGLALVFALTNKHGGNVRIDSTYGEGTTVRVELPTDQDAVRAA